MIRGTTRPISRGVTLAASLLLALAVVRLAVASERARQEWSSEAASLRAAAAESQRTASLKVSNNGSDSIPSVGSAAEAVGQVTHAVTNLAAFADVSVRSSTVLSGLPGTGRVLPVKLSFEMEADEVAMLAFLREAALLAPIAWITGLRVSRVGPADGGQRSLRVRVEVESVFCICER